MRGHEALEPPAGVIDEVAPGPVIEDDPAQGEIGGDEFGDVGSDRDALDIAVKAPRQIEGDLHHRIHQSVVLDRHQD